jgi:aldehyde dehydrogenase (NAD+)
MTSDVAPSPGTESAASIGDSSASGDAFQRAKAAFDDGRTRDESWRRRQLEALGRMLENNGPAIEQALSRDLGKPPFEGWLTDIGSARTEIDHALGSLGKWMKPERVRMPLVAQPGKASVVHEPLGTVLVIAPWNYPVQLVVSPLVGVLAAGNTAVVKPSELAPATSALLADLLPRHLDGVEVVEGGVETSTELLELPFDHIFFTGSTSVGRVVMRAAAENLVPVTLELGGKSPAIVTTSADMEVAATRIAWGKLLNAGQTCIAPDYVLVHRSRRDEFVDHYARAVEGFLGKDPQRSPDYARIVSRRHHDRLTGLIAGDHGGTVVLGGDADADELFIAPTVVVEPDLDSPLMTDEIFGPILPVLDIDDVDQAASFVRSRPKPLALYMFAHNSDAIERVISRTSSGSVCVNHTVVQIAVPELPFGGVGPSGMGRYHGRAGFDTFSNAKSVLHKPIRPEVKLPYPPYTSLKQRILRKLL